MRIIFILLVFSGSSLGFDEWQVSKISNVKPIGRQKTVKYDDLRGTFFLNYSLSNGSRALSLLIHNTSDQIIKVKAAEIEYETSYDFFLNGKQLPYSFQNDLVNDAVAQLPETIKSRNWIIIPPKKSVLVSLDVNEWSLLKFNSLLNLGKIELTLQSLLFNMNAFKLVLVNRSVQSKNDPIGNKKADNTQP